MRKCEQKCPMYGCKGNGGSLSLLFIIIIIFTVSLGIVNKGRSDPDWIFVDNISFRRDGRGLITCRNCLLEFHIFID